MRRRQQNKFDLELKQMGVEGMKTKEKASEDHKDERVRIEGTQQSQLIDQRQNDLLPTSFETNSFEKEASAPDQAESMAIGNPFDPR